MPSRDQLLAAIGAVHAAGLDAELWPAALEAVTRLCGGVASTLEVLDKSTLRHMEFHAFGVPAPHELTYVDHYLALNPRVPHGLRERAGEISWDYKCFRDEAGLARDPFYAEFLPSIGFRYFVSGVLRQTPREFAAVAVQRSPAQGHVSAAEIAMMGTLVPHFQQTLDVARRLKGAGALGRSLQGALDWLADGVALLAADGEIVYANDALQCVARRGDGISLNDGAFAFTDARARDHLAAAFAALLHARNGSGSATLRDFPVARTSNTPPYLLSLRPLERTGRTADLDGRAVAIVFVRDPLRPEASAVHVLREVFGFTPAEASLARALQTGPGPAEYARAHGVSLNTVYTHLRRVKEKTACQRMSDLIGKLRDLQVSLRAD